MEPHGADTPLCGHYSAEAWLNQTINSIHGRGSVSLEANLPGTSTVIAQFLLQMHIMKMFDLENEGQNDAAQHSQ